MTQMNAAQLKAELDAGEELLRTATLARLAYDGVDGTPRVIPIGFLWQGPRRWSSPRTQPRQSSRLLRPATGSTDDRHPEPGALPAAAR